MYVVPSDVIYQRYVCPIATVPPASFLPFHWKEPERLDSNKTVSPEIVVIKRSDDDDGRLKVTKVPEEKSIGFGYAFGSKLAAATERIEKDATDE